MTSITSMAQWSTKRKQMIFAVLDIEQWALKVIKLLRFLSRISILTRDIDIANLSVRLSVRPSIRLSVTFRYQMKMA